MFAAWTNMNEVVKHMCLTVNLFPKSVYKCCINWIKVATCSFKTCRLAYSLMALRTADQANDVYQSGMTFLRQHLHLTRISARTERLIYLALHMILSCFWMWCASNIWRLWSLLAFLLRRRNVLQWLAKPKIHVRCLIAEKMSRKGHRMTPRVLTKSKVWFCIAFGALRTSIISYAKLENSETWRS